jgi:hypothetical protein
MKQENEDQLGVKINYWESRTINIGNYEKIDFGSSVSLTVNVPKSGYGDKTVTISESASITKKDAKNLAETSKMLEAIVKTRLNTNEKKIRQKTKDWEGIGFNTEKKLLALGIINDEEYTGSFDRRHELSDSDLE